MKMSTGFPLKNFTGNKLKNPCATSGFARSTQKPTQKMHGVKTMFIYLVRHFNVTVHTLSYTHIDTHTLSDTLTHTHRL